VIQENLERARWRRRCIKECATAVAQVTGALLNATRLRLAYETYHTRILFFERYAGTLTYSILAYAYPRDMSPAIDDYALIRVMFITKSTQRLA